MLVICNLCNEEVGYHTVMDSKVCTLHIVCYECLIQYQIGINDVHECPACLGFTYEQISEKFQEKINAP